MTGLWSCKLEHWLKNAGLIALSIMFLPTDTLTVVASLINNWFAATESRSFRAAAVNSAKDQRKTVLVTGVGMSKGLVLARIFHQAGWNVVGADFSLLACGRFSRSLFKYYTVARPDQSIGSAPYLEDLLAIILRHQVDLWVSCSAVASALVDGEAQEFIESRTLCRAIQFDINTTRMLHEKHSFLERAANHGLTTPDTHLVTSTEDVKAALQEAPSSRRYIMKPIGMDDANRGNMALLPKETWAETMDHVSCLPISKNNPWILQQFVDGPEYCTHALVIRGHVMAFVACPSAELLMHYTALPQQSELSQAMLQFTTTFAEKEGENFTGHLSFDFIIAREDAKGAKGLQLFPIECNPRAHTAVVLLQEQTQLVSAYSSYLKSSKMAEMTAKSLIVPQSVKPIYWVGHDLVELLLQPIWEALLRRPTTSLKDYLGNIRVFFWRTLYWRDGSFTWWDPLPWWWLYHVYWPSQFAKALLYDEPWNRINVSTTKVFKEAWV